MEKSVYSAPESELLDDCDNQNNVTVFSPTQVACGAFLGGPIGLMYFLMSNFGALENVKAKNKALYGGLVLLVGLLCILPLLPEDFPSMPFTIAYVVAARFIAENHQMTKSDIVESEYHQFQSNWKVFGMGVLCFVASMAAIMVPLLVLSMLGIITL